MTHDKTMATFFIAVKRGEKLHPGPYTTEQWHEALLAEWNEVLAEKSGSQRMREELTDVAVVAYRIAESMRNKIMNRWLEFRRSITPDTDVELPARLDFRDVFVQHIELFLNVFGYVCPKTLITKVVSDYKRLLSKWAAGTEAETYYFNAVIRLAVVCFLIINNNELW